MRSVKSTTFEKNLALRSKRLALISVVSFFSIIVFGQTNSPYSRYGLGDIVPNTNIINRGMAGLAAAYSDPLSINFTNPASYSAFKSTIEAKSRKTVSGRILFDVGLNFENRTLRESNPPAKFSSTNGIFSYMQLGFPLKNNWGLNFGLRPVSNISYKVGHIGPLFDASSGDFIDTALTEKTGDGGSYLASVGTGFGIKSFSAGINFGYLFGKKQYATKIAPFNDSVQYQNSNHTTRTSFGSVFLSGGLNYDIKLDSVKHIKLGAYGNLKHTMDAEQDIIRETFVRTQSGDVRIDSVFQQNDIKGKVVFPASYGIGFIYENGPDYKNNKYKTWLVGVDYIQSQWNDYVFYGAKDSVKNNWEIRVGAQIRPEPGRNYFSNVAYRLGFFTGKDYIQVGKSLPVLGASIGLGLPLRNYNRSIYQASIINVALEFIKRGNKDNLLSENTFRVSVGLSFSDLWFIKRKYD